MYRNSTVSITFGDVAENHRGMQQIGNLASEGFNLNDLSFIKNNFEKIGCVCYLYSLHDALPENMRKGNEAFFLVIKNALNVMFNDVNASNRFYEEQLCLDTDKKAFMYGRVVNKHARHNLCFSEVHQEPNYEAKQGRVYAFSEVPCLNALRQNLPFFIGQKGINLQAEGNYYFDQNSCGIGYHGDAERKKVIAVRLGPSIPLCFYWYQNNERISNIIPFQNLEHGDMYIMSEKTTGFDWKSKSKITLRHAAGCSKYIS